MLNRGWQRAGLLVGVLALLGCAGERPHGQHGGAPVAGPPVRFDNLGTYSHRITTALPAAQAWFDQGLRWLYGFNHQEAQRAFREAARVDPACAMCLWGVALSYGSNYNSPTDPGREQEAYQAIQQARTLAAGATPAERALIEALARRHSADPKANRVALDVAYAEAMREVARRFPDDLEAQTLFADAMMNLRPWDLWKADGRPQAGTEEIVATLERALAKDPKHPGANHLYIHAVEASPDPGRGTAAADRLAPLMPGAGHMVHMPSHIYFRVGRYDDARTANVRAVAADRAYFAKSQPSEIYRMMYFPHNLDFVWVAASMEGRGQDTVVAAQEFAGAIPLALVREHSDMETAPAAPLFALARFGRWNDVLARPRPPADLPYVTGAWRYTRGLAFSATGRRAEAEAELQALRELTLAVSPDRTLAGFFKTADMLRLATHVLAGEITARQGQTDVAVRELTEAVKIQDGHWFTEPPPWYFPVRQSLGAALLQGGRPAEAEAVYREDLRRNPENGWSLFGLAQSLRAQGKTAEAAQAEARFKQAWARADVTITASRF